MPGKRPLGVGVVVAVVVGLVGTFFASQISNSAPHGPGTAVDDKAAKAAAQSAYGKLPMSFEANAGQTDAGVDFVARGSGYRLFLTPSEAVMSLQKQEQAPEGAAKTKGKADKGDRLLSESDVLRMQLVGSNPSAAPAGNQPLPGKANYLTGDRSQWHTNVPTYGEVSYAGVYPGIDMKYHGTNGALEYDFVVAPGADPNAIRLRMAGAQDLSIGTNGDLVIKTAAGDLRQHKPVIFQEVNGQRHEVPGEFVLGADHQVSFSVAAYDHAFPLVIDPSIAYSTYLGGSTNDFGFGIAVDKDGNAYLGGQTSSTVFPRGQSTDPTPKGATAGAFQTALGGGADGFVLKMNPAGTALVYSTYLGAKGSDAVFDLVVDATGNAYVGGATDSADDPGTVAVEPSFPTTDGTNGTVAAYDNTCGTDGRCNNVLPPNFSQSTCDPLFDPSDGDPNVADCDPANPQAGTEGFLPAVCPPATNPAGCATPPGPADDFVAKLSADGSKLLYSSLVGGSDVEQNADEVPYAGQLGIALKGTSVYLTATTFSTDFPTTKNAFQRSCASCADGANDAYLTVLDTAKGGAAGLRYSTYVGGSGFDEGKGVAVDNNGKAYLTGVITGVSSEAGSTTFPVKNPLSGTYLGSGKYDGSKYHGGYSDAYLTKINPAVDPLDAAKSLVYSSFIGGGGKEEGWSVALQPGSNAPFLTGYTASGANPHGQVADPAHPGACASGPGPFCDWASDPAPYFPVTAGSSQTTFAGRVTTDSGSTLFLDGDAFVMKVNGTGTTLAWSTFLGGPNADYGQSIAVDSTGHAYVTGWTTCRTQDPAAKGNNVPPSTDGPEDHTPPQFDPDGVPTGRTPGEPAATGVPDCPAGFPTVNAGYPLNVMNSTNIDNHTNDSPTAAFVAKLKPSGSALDYAALIDGRGFDRGFSIALRELASGPPEVYITGRTGNASQIPNCQPQCAFPLTPGSYDTTYNGAGRDAFITKLVG